MGEGVLVACGAVFNVLSCCRYKEIAFRHLLDWYE